MRRLIALYAVLAVGLICLFAVAGVEPTSAVQNGTPAALAGHPLVGAWVLDTDADDPANPPSLAIFHDDGTYLQTDTDGSNGIGSWEATGERTAALTAHFYAEEDGQLSSATVRAAIEVAPDRQTLTADYTLEFALAGGEPSGELGPGRATGERITVEEPGTPVASMAEAFGTPAP